jgi:hypothetical protein
VKWYWRGAIAGVAVEALACVPLLIGRWEFLGEVDAVARIALILHSPGFWAARALRVHGNASWLLIVGLPLLLWVGVAEVCFLVESRLRGSRAR